MATYYFRNAGTDWGTAANWSLTSGGGATGAVPTAADDAIFNINSTNCTVNASSRVCKTLTFTGYTNTITMSNQISVSGNITLQAGLLVAGTGKLLMIVTGTLTSNGFSWPNDFEFKGTSQTYTLAANFTVLGQLICLGTTAITINGAFTLFCNGGTFTTATGGTATIEITGGNWSGTCNNTMNLNSAGTITLAGTIGRSSGTLTWVAGTINNSGNYSLSYSGGSINVGNNITWNNITMGTGTITLVNSLYASGSLITGNGGTFNGAHTIYCTGITQNNTTNQINGTATVELNGTGTWTATTTNTNWGIDTVINCGANTLTINSGRNFGSSVRVPTLTYTSGIVNCLGSILFYNCILATNGMTFNNVSLGASSIGAITVTLSNDMDIAGNLTVQGNGNLTTNGNQINLSGSFINNMSAANSTGTTIINMNGTGSIQTTGSPTNWINPITINTAGTITLSGANTYGGNLIYTTGAVVSTGAILTRSGGTMTINSSSFNLNSLVCSANSVFTGSNGFNINNLTVNPGVNTVWGGGNTYNILQSLTSIDTQTLNGTAPNRALFTGTNNAVFTAGINPATTMTVSSFVYGSGTLKAGDYVYTNGYSTPWLISSTGSAQGGVGTYTVVSNGVAVASRTFVDSGSGAPRPYVRLSTSATQNVLATNAVDVDSSQGQTIIVMPNQTVSGTYYYLQNATNWNSLTTPKTSGYTWVS